MWISFWFFCAVALTTELPAPTYDLAPKYREGSVRRFRDSSSQKMVSMSLPGGQFQTAMDLVISEKVQKVFPDGRVWLMITIETVKSDLSNASMGAYQLTLLIGKPVIVWLDSAGQLESVVTPDDLQAEALPAFEVLKQKIMMEYRFSTLPEKPIPMGHTWENRCSFMLPTPVGEMDHIIGIKSKLDREVEWQGRPCLVVNFEGTMEGLIDKGEGGSFQGTFKGTRLVDIEGGAILNLEFQAQSTTEILTNETERHFEMTTKSYRTALPNGQIVR